MKQLLLLCLLACAGCDRRIEQASDGATLIQDATGQNVTLVVVTNSGHKFAVAMTSHGSVAIVEIIER